MGVALTSGQMMELTNIFTFKNTTFLDTGALLHAFAIYMNSGELASYLKLEQFHKFTFEKCIYETHMAFRGVGGKKPDEGRGDWAARHLKGECYPSTLNRISSKHHAGNNGHAAYWLNNLEEVMYSLGLTGAELPDFDVWAEREFERTKNNIKNPDKNELNNILRPIYDLAVEKIKFHDLSALLDEFISTAEITVITYHEVFHKYWMNTTEYTGDIRWHATNTIIPSEDLEIILCAELVQADLFLTSDKRLRKCMFSLGNNSSLHANNIVDVQEFHDWEKSHKASKSIQSNANAPTD